MPGRECTRGLTPGPWGPDQTCCLPCAWNGRSVSSGILFPQNATRSQTGVSDGPGGDRTSQSFWIWLPASRSTLRWAVLASVALERKDRQ